METINLDSTTPSQCTYDLKVYSRSALIIGTYTYQ